MITPGRKSKLSFTIFKSSWGVLVEVPKEKTDIDNGSAIPMAYDNCDSSICLFNWFGIVKLT